MAMILGLPSEIEDQLKQVAEIEHRSVQQTVLVAIEEYLSMREGDGPPRDLRFAPGGRGRCDRRVHHRLDHSGQAGNADLRHLDRIVSLIRSRPGCQDAAP